MSFAGADRKQEARIHNVTLTSASFEKQEAYWKAQKYIARSISILILEMGIRYPIFVKYFLS
jgi:hypothetical protein